MDSLNNNIPQGLNKVHQDFNYSIYQLEILNITLVCPQKVKEAQLYELPKRY
jgi:hypothetical protein